MQTEVLCLEVKHVAKLRRLQKRKGKVDISGGYHESVKKFLGKYPTLKILHNDKKESIAAIALKFGQIGIYETLLGRGFCLGISEVDAVTQNLDRATKGKLREIHKKCLIDPKLDHLTSLLSKCKLSHDALESEHVKFFSMIAKSLIDLNEIEGIEPLLKVVSCSDQLEIIFDFHQQSVQHMVPAYGTNTRGLCFYYEDYIYVAAGTQPQELLGTIAHEICHYALDLVYKNRCKPYKMNNATVADKFEKILVACEAKKDLEAYIGYVFNKQLYKTYERHCKLIVRVPHLYAMYNEDTKRLEKLKVEFRELFEFYEVEVVKDVKRHYELSISCQHIKEINKFSGLSTTLKQSKLQLKSGELSVEHDESNISIVSSSCVQLTMVANKF